MIAKRRDLPYQFGNRDGMQKIKKLRSADCIVGGFRYAERRTSGRKVAASLLLGLYDDHRLLHHVGFTSALKSAETPALTDRLEAIVKDFAACLIKSGGRGLCRSQRFRRNATASKPTATARSHRPAFPL